MLGTLVPSATAVAALGLWPMWHTAVPVALVTLALFAALFAAGVVLMAEPGQVPAGIAMMLSAALLIVSWANEWGAGPLPLVSDVVGNLWVPVVAWALYRYPHQRLARGDRWMFTVALAWFVATSWLLVFLSRPEWHRFPPHWWPTLFPSLPVYQVVTRVVDVGTVGLALLYVSWWVVRLRRAGSVERRIKIPTAAAAIAAVTIGGTLYLGYALDLPEPVSNVLFVLTMCSMLAIPVAFLVAVIRRYLSRSALTQVLISLGNSPTTRQITAALRQGLGDPDLLILYWSQDERSYLDEARQPVADPRGKPARWSSRSGRPRETTWRSWSPTRPWTTTPSSSRRPSSRCASAWRTRYCWRPPRRGSLTCKRPAPVSSRPAPWSAAGSSRICMTESRAG